MESFYEYEPYVPDLDDLVLDTPTQHQPKDYVMAWYLGKWLHGVVQELNNTERFYLVKAFFFNEKNTRVHTKMLIIPNRYMQIHSMTDEDRMEFYRLLWLCDVDPESDL